MSEQEKQSGGSAVNTSLLVGGKTTDHHKQPYRPTELKEDSEIHHKRPSAPLVPSADEDLKLLTEDTNVSEETKIKEQIKSISSDKHKQNAARKLSLSTERREHSPESITLATMEVDRKKGPATSLPQIPPDISTTEEDKIESEKKYAKQYDEDSITEEVVELPNPETAKEHSEWSDDEEAGGLPRSDSRASRVSRMANVSTTKSEKNKITWRDDMICKEVSSKALDRKASITPCYRSMGPHERPSGITINLPTKCSYNCGNRTSGININISKKFQASKVNMNENEEKHCETSKHNSDQMLQPSTEGQFAIVRDTIKQKFSNVQAKIKNIFQM